MKFDEKMYSNLSVNFLFQICKTFLFCPPDCITHGVRVIGASVTRLGNLLDFGRNFSKPVATIVFPKLTTLLGNFCKGVKMFHFLVKSFLGNFHLLLVKSSMAWLVIIHDLSL